MQRMKKENEQQKQTDTPTLEGIIDENVQQSHEIDLLARMILIILKLNKLGIQLKNENLTI